MSTAKTSQNVTKGLDSFIEPERIYRDEVRRTAYSVDASMFDRVAKTVVDLQDEQEVVKLLEHARTTGTPITFRAGGTSINGQCSGSGILARIRGPFWNQTKVMDDGRYIQAWSGVLGAKVNELLKPFQKMMGPDPASLASANMGGIIVNNAAGMCCTVEQNAYATMKDIRIVLADGTILDTSDAESVAQFRKSHTSLLYKLIELRNELLSKPEVAERIKRKYKIKNTCGYAVNAFVDFEDPIDILTHLMIGSEGTLGFVTNTTLKTIDCHSFRATTLIFFPDLRTGTKAVSRWLETKAANAAELFDGPTLQALVNLPIAPKVMKGIDSNACCVLLEAKASNQEELQEKVDALSGAISDLEVLSDYEFFTDEEKCESLWAFRRALFPACVGNREAHESVLLEDICFPVDKIEEGVSELGKLFGKYGYIGGVHGHAFHGNFHFAIPVDLSTEKELHKMHQFLDEVMQVVVSYDGSLKAEHGTGYAVAPFVKMEWGQQIYDIMCRTKKLLDPFNILNPGVLINDDPTCHTKSLRVPIASHPKLDKCVNCGFCEPVCPSGKIASSPRQRVSLWRAIAHLKDSQPAKALEWEKAYDKLGTDLCATDGICTTRCPMRVDVAGFVRDRRDQLASKTTKKIANKVGCSIAGATRGAALLLNGVALVQRLAGDAFMYKSSGLAEKIVGPSLPTWNAHMPKGAKKLPATSAKGNDVVVYVPSCAIRTMGDSVHDPAESLADVTLRVLERAGFRVVYPDNINKLCCGKAFETKGLFEEADNKSREMEAVLLKASENGKYPILCETSPCLARMRKVMDERLKMYEPVEFASKYLVDRLTLHKVAKKIAIHPTCSTRLMGLAEPFMKLAQQCAEEVVWPQDIQCCGFSGDKGFSHPQLNEVALATLKNQIQGCDMGYSTSRTCEIGLSLHGEVPYRNIFYLIDECMGSAS